MEEFIFNLMSNFIIRDQLYTNAYDLSTFRGSKELLDVDVSLKRSQLSSSVAYEGTKVKSLLLYESASDADTTKFRKDRLKFYAKATNDLIQNLVFSESLVIHAQYLNLRNRIDANLQMLYQNLALKFGGCF